MNSYQLSSIKELFGADYASSVLIICANQRQARDLQQNKHLSTNRVDKTLPIYAFNTWLEILWLELQDRNDPLSNRALIDDLAESLLWQEVLDDLPQTPIFVDNKKLYQQLKSAYKIISDYNITQDELEGYSFEENDFFVKAIDKFKRKLSLHDLTTISEFAKTLVGETSLSRHVDMKQVLFYGFIDVPPLLISLFENSVKPPARLLRESPQESISHLAFETEREEIGQAAKWAKTVLQQEPGTKVAIIVPDLHNLKYKINRQFDIEFDLNQFLFSEDHQISSIYDISAGDPIGKCPVIAAALSLTKLFKHSLTLDEAKSIIRSQYWGSGFNFARQLCLKKLESLRQTTVSRSLLVNLLLNQENEEELNSTLQSNDHSLLIQLFSEFSWTKTQKKTLEEWTSILIHSLKTLNYPRFSPNSYEYQAIQNFSGMLDSLKKLDNHFSRSHDVQAFLSILNLAVQTQIFHPEVKQPEIRVMGLMEAAGLEFEHCLILGLVETSFPSTPSPNPLIPFELQKLKNTPRSTAQREFNYAKDLLNTIITHSKNVVLSCSRQNGNGDETNVSPVVLSILNEQKTAPYHPIASSNLLEDYYDASLTEDSLERKYVGNAPSIPKGSSIDGGAYHLGLYWANPLFSFFKYRLHMNDIEIESLGMDARRFGIAVHTILASFYSQHSTLAELKDLISNQDLRTALRSIIEDYLSNDMRDVPFAIKNYMNEQLVAQLEDFIAEDSTRDQEFIVKATELSLEASVSDWTYKLRIDRLDQVENKNFIVDYKTASSSLSGLVKKLLVDYQLPLYSCCFEENQIAGAAYAFINDDNTNYSGFGDESLDIPGIVDASTPHSSELTCHWEGLLDHWRTQVGAVTQNIARGEVPYLDRNSKLISHHDYLSITVRSEEKA